MTTLQEVRERFAHVEDVDERERLMCEALMAPPEPPPEDPHRHVPATANGRRRRNYGAMGEENLLRSIRELQRYVDGTHSSRDPDNAAWQCRGRGHDPADDLWLATSIARRKGWL